MKLEHSFEVKAPIDAVWEALIDVERVAPCLPGAEVTESDEDGVYKGNFTVKLGPTTAAYRGKLEMVETDEGAHRATMKASGSDKRGQGTAKATIISTLTESEGKTQVATDTDFTITGKLARFGRGGMIKDVSNKLLRDFSSCLAETIESSGSAGTEAAPSGAGGEGGGAETGAGGGGAETAADGGSADPAADAPAQSASGAVQAGKAPAPGQGDRHTQPAQPQPRAAEPVKGFSLLVSVVWERIKRLVQRLRSRGRS